MTTDTLSLITPDTTIFSLKATTTKTLFEEVIAHLIAKNILPSDLREVALEALENRESRMSTAIGKGLAIPHASIHNLPTVIKLLARSEKGIGTSPSDGLPVRFFHLTLIPDDDYSAHLRTIAAISSFFRKETNISKLHSAISDADLRSVFTETGATS